MVFLKQVKVNTVICPLLSNFVFAKIESEIGGNGFCVMISLQGRCVLFHKLRNGYVPPIRKGIEPQMVR